MNVVMINGSLRKESTYNIGKLLINKLISEKDTLKEFFLPRDLPKFCCGCNTCFTKSEENCPHYEYTSILTKAMDEADLLVFTTPVYVYHTSGQMKTFLDHYGYRWMVHRPNGVMFKKVAVIISTAAGGGMKSTNKDIKDSLDFWGVGKTYPYGKGVAAISWDGVSNKKKQRINLDIDSLARKVRNRISNPHPSIKIKSIFYIMRMMQKKVGFNKPDVDYWEAQGWLGKVRPWR